MPQYVLQYSTTSSPTTVSVTRNIITHCDYINRGDPMKKQRKFIAITAPH